MQEQKKELLKKLTSTSSAATSTMYSERLSYIKPSIYTFFGVLIFSGFLFLIRFLFSSDDKSTEQNINNVHQSAPPISASPSSISSPSVTGYALNASGYVVARRKATVSSEATGKIADILVEEGQGVVAGDILATLDNREAMANYQFQYGLMNSISADALEIESQLRVAQRALSRSELLSQKKLISSVDHENAMANFEQLTHQLESKRASLEQAKGALALAKKRLEDVSIRAPFDGVVTMKNAQPGEIVSPVSTGGGFTRTGICTLVDMTSLEIEVDVNENYISKVFLSQPVDVALNAFPDKKYLGKVIAIIPQGNRQSSTIKVRVKLQDLDSHVFPDMGVAVSFHQNNSSGYYGGL